MKTWRVYTYVLLVPNTPIPRHLEVEKRRFCIQFSVYYSAEIELFERRTNLMAAGIATKCVLQAGVKIGRQELVVPAKGPNALKIGTAGVGQLVIGKGGLAIRIEYALNRQGIFCQASGDSTSVVKADSMESGDADTIPTPIVLIDQDTDSNATIVEVSFGDRLGALLDTMKALTDLGLDVVKGSVLTEALVIRTRLFITRFMLYIETADRPGLLMEIIKIMQDININVESAEIDTEGLVAKDKFHVSYQGAALSNSIAEVLTNCLRYYLRRPETDEDSY